MLWLWLPLALLGSVLLVAAVPVRLAFEAEAHGTGTPPRRRVTLALFDGRVPAITLADSGTGTPRRKPRPTRPGKRRTARKGAGGAFPVAAVLRLLRDLLACVQIERLRVSGVFGLADPVETGLLYGRICPLKYGLPGAATVLDVTPDFSGPRLDGRAEGVLRLRPLALVPPGLRFGWQMLRARA